MECGTQAPQQHHSWAWSHMSLSHPYRAIKTVLPASKRCQKALVPATEAQIPESKPDQLNTATCYLCIMVTEGFCDRNTCSDRNKRFFYYIITLTSFKLKIVVFIQPPQERGHFLHSSTHFVWIKHLIDAAWDDLSSYVPFFLSAPIGLYIDAALHSRWRRNSTYESLSLCRFAFPLTGIPFIYSLSERSGLDLSEIACSILAEKPLEYILQTLQPLSGLLIVPASLTAWSRHGWCDERRRHHAANTSVIHDCI